IAVLRSGDRRREMGAVLCANIALPLLVASGVAILIFGLLSTARSAPEADKVPEVHLHFDGESFSFEVAGRVGPFVTGKANTLESAASLGEVVKGLSDRGKAREQVFLLLVGSADKFELSSTVRREYGSNSGLARARAEWVAQEIRREWTSGITAYLT